MQARKTDFELSPSIIWGIVLVLIIIIIFKELFVKIFIALTGIFVALAVVVIFIRFSPQIVNKIRKLIKRMLSKPRPLPRDNFHFPFLLEVIDTCKKKTGECKGLKLFKEHKNHKIQEYTIDNITRDDLEGTKLTTIISRSKAHYLPLSRVNFIIKFPKGFNWINFSYLEKLVKNNNCINITTNLLILSKLKSGEPNCKIYLINGEIATNAELVDLGEDGVLVFSYDEERLVYIPWKFVNSITFQDNPASSDCKKEEVIEGFILCFTSQLPVSLIKKETLNSLSNENKTAETNRTKSLEEIW